MLDKIIRSICYYQNDINVDLLLRFDNLGKKLKDHGYLIQTKRVCSPNYGFTEIEKIVNNQEIFLSVGEMTYEQFIARLTDFYQTKNVACNLDMTTTKIEMKHVELLFDIIQNKPEHTFRFTYGFNLPVGSPYYPSAKYGQDGFCIGLQPTDLAEHCSILEEWLHNMEKVWQELNDLFQLEEKFLGIDSSIAPLFQGKSSLIYFVKKLGIDFSHSVTTDLYTQITAWIKNRNPKPIGLCGLMVPCLEDFELAAEYESGNFSIERNIFLSLHSGLGIDVYPVGINENKERVLEILRLIQALSNKYRKPLAVRFVSDGKAKIGEKTDFKNQYLKDIVVRTL